MLIILPYLDFKYNKILPFKIYYNNLHNILIMKHKITPTIVGIKNEKIVHLKLPVSFFIVKQVVEHGK